MKKLLVLLLFVPLLCHGQHHNFVYLGCTNSDSVFIDKNIFKVGKYYRTWVRFVYRSTEEGEASRKEMINLDEKFNNLCYSLDLEEFDILNQRRRTISVCYYDINDNLLDTSTRENTSWDFIVPNSIGENEYHFAKSLVNHKNHNKKHTK